MFVLSSEANFAVNSVCCVFGCETKSTIIKAILYGNPFNKVRFSIYLRRGKNSELSILRVISYQKYFLGAEEGL